MKTRLVIFLLDGTTFRSKNLGEIDDDMTKEELDDILGVFGDLISDPGGVVRIMSEEGDWYIIPSREIKVLQVERKGL